MELFEKKTGTAFRTALCTAFVVMALVLSLIVLSVLFVPKNNQEAFGMIQQKAHGILGEPENTIDVLFVGDSELYSSVSPMQIWDERGFASYVCATPWQTLPYSKTLLHRATKNQKPKVVVIETDAIFRTFSINDAVFREAQNILPIFEFHNRWKTLKVVNELNFPEFTWTDDMKGFRYNRKVKSANAAGHMNPSNEVKTIPRLNEQYLKGMIAYCREIGAIPVLISTPSTVCWNTARHNGIAEFAKNAGVDYVDLNVEPTKVPIDWATDTRDAGDHLNFSGAMKVSWFIGKYLSDTYSLPDHRGDETYRPWNEALVRYNNRISQKKQDILSVSPRHRHAERPNSR